MSTEENQAKLFEHTIGLLKDVSPWITFFITITLIIWAVSRARSAHFLLDRVWRLIGGGVINDPDLAKKWAEIRDVEGFRFRTGLNFPTKQALSKTLFWLDTHQMSIQDLSFARAWTTSAPWKFKKPNLTWIRRIVAVEFIILGVLSLSTCWMAVQPSVLLSVKTSGVKFWTDGSSATDFKLLWKEPKFSVTHEDCKENKINDIDDKDAQVICATVSPEANKAIKTMLREQQALSWYIVFICFCFLIAAARYSARASMAKKFYDLSPP
jgi:hypothetical protein